MGRGAVVSLVVRDRGQWRSPREDGRGRGFLLMNALVDEVEVRPGPEGTEVRLRRELGRALGEGPPGPPLSPTFAATSPEAPVEVARFEGDIDLPRARELEPELFRAVGNEALGLVVDLSGVRHIDSAGVRLLFQLAARLELRRQRLAVVVPTGSSVRRVLDLVGLDACAQLAPTVDEAITSLRRSQPPTML
jgi:anti-anti-sigma factor